MLQYLSTPHSYSSAVKAGDFIFLGLHRGQGDNFNAQIQKAIKSLENSLKQFDCSLADCVKIHVYLKSIADLNKMEVYFKDVFEQGAYPARMTTTTEFCDDDCLIMIDGIAYANEK